MKDTDLDRFGELSGDAQIAVAQLLNAIASLGLNGDWADVEHWDEIAAFVDDATNKVRTYGRDRPALAALPPGVAANRARLSGDMLDGTGLSGFCDEVCEKIAAAAQNFSDAPPPPPYRVPLPVLQARARRLMEG